eukprot:scaffold266108_cov24-Prasinocladus_malaysianus.AAC.1
MIYVVYDANTADGCGCAVEMARCVVGTLSGRFTSHVELFVDLQLLKRSQRPSDATAEKVKKKQVLTPGLRSTATRVEGVPTSATSDPKAGQAMN